MASLLKIIRDAVSTAPLLIGEVVAVSGTEVRIQQPDGSLSMARGSATVGSTVYFRPGGMVEGDAPTGPFVDIEV